MKVLTINMWVGMTDLAQRLNVLTRFIDAEKPTIVCLQECFAPCIRAEITRRLGAQYHIVASTRRRGDPFKYPWVCYVPSGVLALLGMLLHAIGGVGIVAAIVLCIVLVAGVATFPGKGRIREGGRGYHWASPGTPPPPMAASQAFPKCRLLPCRLRHLPM